MDLGIAGKIALVTGGSRGLGRACADALAMEGARVALLAKQPERVEAAAEDIRNRFRTDSIGLAGDMNRPEEVAGLIGRLRETWGVPDILVVNTGRPPIEFGEVLDEQDETRWEQAYRTFLRGATNVLGATVPLMIEKKGGRVVAITSASVKQPMPHHSLSTVFRAGLAGYLKHLANEVACHGITVNSVCPAGIETETFRRRSDLEERRRNSPLRRLGLPEDLGALVAFLASSKAGYITGTTLQVDGGMTGALS